MHVPRTASALLVLASLGCGTSNEGGGGAIDAGADVADAASSVDATPNDAGADASVDAPPDAPPPDLLAPLRTCVGASAALTVSSQMPYVDVAVGATSGKFVVDFGSTSSFIDLKAFPAPGPTTSGCNAALLGVVCTVQGFAFFAAPGDVVLTTADFSHVTGSVRQAGLVGTDFTSLQTFTLDYAKGAIYAAHKGAFCDDAALASAGFVALSAAGFYSKDLGQLEPATVIDSAASAGARVPNVPTVPVKVAGVAAIAQLDTGFDDGVTPFSVNINEPLRAAIAAASPSALVRDGAHDLTLTTCVSGVSESVQAYRLGAGASLDFVKAGGGVARRYANAAVYVKNAPAAAHACGGIGTWTAPAAQVAASYFVDMGVVAFDPFTSRVWAPTR